MSIVGELEVALERYPLLLTVEEAAEVLRISRSLAYELAHRYETSDGHDGIPVLRVGSCLRVPRWALVELIATGRVVRLADEADLERRRTDREIFLSRKVSQEPEPPRRRVSLESEAAVASAVAAVPEEAVRSTSSSSSRRTELLMSRDPVPPEARRRVSRQVPAGGIGRTIGCRVR